METYKTGEELGTLRCGKFGFHSLNCYYSADLF